MMASRCAKPSDGYEVGVHIVDAAALVPLGGVLDHAARERMTSLYLPENTLPMLPRALSENRGSLSQGQHSARGLASDAVEPRPSAPRLGTVSLHRV